MSLGDASRFLGCSVWAKVVLEVAAAGEQNLLRNQRLGWQGQGDISPRSRLFSAPSKLFQQPLLVPCV